MPAASHIKYDIYIYKVLRQVHPDFGLNSATLKTVNSVINHLANIIVQQAISLVTVSKPKATIDTKSIANAVELVLTGDLAKHAISEGAKA